MLRTQTTTRAARRWIGLVALVSSLAIAGGKATAQSEQQELVNRAETTFSTFMRDPDATWLQRHIGEARAVLIAPQIVKAGWVLGGAGGRAVLFARDEHSGRWTGPAFYDVAAASIGFQAGISVSETVTLVMTQKGLNSLLASSAKLGGDVSIAAGPVGAGANANVTADLVAFSRSKGLYGGLNLEGSVLHVSDKYNRAYYGTAALPPDILVRATVHNPQADRMVADLNRLASRKKSDDQS